MNTPTLPVLTGTAVTLRPITDADTDLIVKWRNTPSVVQNFIFRQTFTPEMHRNWLATKVATGQVVQYIILDNADGKLIPAAYERTAKALLDQKIITKAPTGAYTTAITDKAIK